MNHHSHDPPLFHLSGADFESEKLPVFIGATLKIEFPPDTSFLLETTQSHQLFGLAFPLEKQESFSPQPSESGQIESPAADLPTSGRESTPDSQESDSPELVGDPTRDPVHLTETTLALLKKWKFSAAALRSDSLLLRKKTVFCPAPGCHRKFKRAVYAIMHFIEHNKTEQGVRVLCPYQDCPWGVLGLCSRLALNRHTETVHDGVTIKCEGCPKEFKRSDGLARHMQRYNCKPKASPKEAAKPKSEAELSD